MILDGDGAMEAFGARLAAVLRVGDIVALSGELGAGKTTLARGVLRGLGLAAEAPSPSFTIVQTYDPPEVRLPVWHVDLYRLDGPEEAAELGLDEAWDHAAMLIEWPERLGDDLSDAALRLRLDGAGEATRRLTAEVPGGLGDAVALADMIPPPATPAFLERAGWSGAAVAPLAGDASFRRYFRVTAPRGRAVLMDAPPDKEDSRPFLTVAAHLSGLGFSAPMALAVDLDAGLVLLEDFGDARVNPVLAADPARERAVYEAAVDLLVALHGFPPCDVAPYDEEVLRREVRLLPEWTQGQAADAGFDRAWSAVWQDVLAETAADPVLVLRDYHADNLMLLDRPGHRGLGLLDFQDALAGHRAYDLVSLLQDARRDVPTALEAAMLDRYLAATGLDAGAFRAAYDVLGAQRNTKIVGIFSRLAKRDGKRHYLDLQPRVWGYLKRNLASPALAPVATWFASQGLPA